MENGHLESCRRKAGILISGLCERIGSSRLCTIWYKMALFHGIWLRPAVLRAAARLAILLRESDAAGFAKTTFLELPPSWNPYLGAFWENRKQPASHT